MDHPSDGGIGVRVRNLRRARGMKQQDLAGGEISVSYVSLIESGKRAPSEAVLTALSERLGCSLEFLRSGKDDTRTADLKTKIAFADMAMRNGANGEALQAYSEALASAPFLDEATVRRARIGQAHALEKLGRLEAALQLLTPLFEDDQTVPGSAEWTQVAVTICRCYREVGDFTMSVEFGERALKQLTSLGLDATDDHVQLGSSLVGAYLMRGDLTRAHLLAEQIIQETELVGSPVARGSIYWNAALVAHSRGSTHEALALAERALGLMSESDHARHIAMLRSMYGNLLVLHGEESDLDRAEQLFRQAHQHLVETGTAAEQARTEVHMGHLMLRRRDFAAAQEHASRAIGLLRNDPRPETVEARAALAEAQFGRGNTEMAVETLKAAVHQLQQVPPNWTSARTWRRIAELWVEFGLPDEAVEAYGRALSDAGIVPLARTGRAPTMVRSGEAHSMLR